MRVGGRARGEGGEGGEVWEMSWVRWMCWGEMVVHLRVAGKTVMYRGRGYQREEMFW